MEEINCIKILVVSMPETLAGIYAAFLLTGWRRYLPFRDNPENRKDNVVKLVIAVIILTASQVLDRFYLDIGNAMLVNAAWIIVVFRVVYSRRTNKDKCDKNGAFKLIKAELLLWVRPLIQTLIIYTILISVESVYMPLVLKAMNLRMTEILKPKYWYDNLILPQVDRYFQILIIVSAWNKQRAAINIKLYKMNKWLYIGSFSFIILLEFFYTYIYISQFPHFADMQKITLFFPCILVFAFNYSMYKLITSPIDKVVSFLKSRGKNEEYQKVEDES